MRGPEYFLIRTDGKGIHDFLDVLFGSPDRNTPDRSANKLNEAQG